VNYNPQGSGDRPAIKSDGTVTLTPDPITGNMTLVGSTTYYIELGSTSSPVTAEAALASVHLKWALAVAATITVETSNFPAFVGGRDNGVVGVTSWDTTVGNWVQENPSAAVVAVVGSGNSATALTITAGGTAAGAATIHLGNLGTRRARVKLVVTTGGALRCNVAGKMGA
jgi:hypothetical protein